jgi:hypothetical protein
MVVFLSRREGDGVGAFSHSQEKWPMNFFTFCQLINRHHHSSPSYHNAATATMVAAKPMAATSF